MNNLGPVFREGDEVVLCGGVYTGTPGVFLRLRPDANWADITERNGNVRSHPTQWLALAGPAIEVWEGEGGPAATPRP